MNIWTFRDSLILDDDQAETALSAIPFDNSHQILHFGVKGEAPGELLQSAKYIDGSAEFECYNLAKRAVIAYNFASVLSDSSTRGREIFKFPDGIFFSMVKVSSDIYVGTTLRDYNRITIVDKSGTIIGHHGAYPAGDADVKDTLNYIKSLAYYANMCRQKDGKRIAMACNWADILEIYEWDPTESKLRTISQIINLQLQYMVYDRKGTPNFMLSKETVTGFLDITQGRSSVMR